MRNLFSIYKRQKLKKKKLQFHLTTMDPEAPQVIDCEDGGTVGAWVGAALLIPKAYQVLE